MGSSSALRSLKKVVAFIWKWLNLVVFWSPALRRKFLTNRSKPLYERFQRTIFLFPQLARLFVALGLLSLTLLVLSIVVVGSNHSCHRLSPQMSQVIVLSLHAVFLLIKLFLPAVFQKCHILFEGISAITIAFTNDFVTSCDLIAELGVVRVTFSAFYMLVVTIYFQYSTLLTVIFCMYRISAPLVLFGDSAIQLLTTREVSIQIYIAL